MEKTYKQIPFNLDLAKKIFNGEVEGRFVTDGNDHWEVRILCFDRDGIFPIVALIGNSTLTAYDIYGKSQKRLESTEHKLLIEIPEENKKEGYNFKPFDKVLAKNYDNCGWIPAFYQGGHNIESNPYKYFASGVWYRYCIPYEGTNT